MSPGRAAAASPNALSFARAAFRELVRGRWQLEKLRVQLDEQGRGDVLYRLSSGKWRFHFFVLSNSFPAQMKVDRNFGVNWDAMAVLCEGPWSAEREAHLRREIPKARAGFTDYDTLMFARGNRSGRLFDNVVEALAQGRQPDGEELARVGYILRTTAFIGNGAISTRPFRGFGSDHPFVRPYHAQMVAGFLLREYVYDLVDQMARARSASAVSLAPAYRRYLGLGNSAATGLVPFVVHRPRVLDRWCRVQENAFAQARARRVTPGDGQYERFQALLVRAIRYHEEDRRQHNGIFADSAQIALELARIGEWAGALITQGPDAGAAQELAASSLWETLFQRAQKALQPATVEVLLAIVLELHPDIVDEVSGQFAADEHLDIDPAMHVSALAALVQTHYAWTQTWDLDDPAQRHYFWYRGKAAPLDMRRGVRGLLPALEFEMGTDLVLRIRQLRTAIGSMPADARVGHLLLAHPALRYVVTRVQALAGNDYAELRTNYLAREFSPFAPIRLILAFYGMEKLDPAQPKSVRGAFLQGAPTAEDVAAGRDGDWPFALRPFGEVAQAHDAPAAPVDSAAHPATPAMPEEAPTQVCMSPSEFERYAQRAMQARGASFGVSLETARALSFLQRTAATGLTVLLHEVTAGRFVTEPRTLLHDDGVCTVLDARGASALQVASEALDLATMLATGGPGAFGLCAVRRTGGMAVLDECVLRAARRGCEALLITTVAPTHAGQEHTYRLVLAGNGPDGPWWLAAEGSRNSRFAGHLLALLDDRTDLTHACTRAVDWLQTLASPLQGLIDPAMGPDASLPLVAAGFVMLCWRPADGPMLGANRSIEKLAAVLQDLERPGRVDWRDSARLLREEQTAHTAGFTFAIDQWRSLIAAAGELLIATDDEVTLRPDGLDPQLFL